MDIISDENFQELINKALEELPGEHVKNIKNVAILYEDFPTPEQRYKLQLSHNRTLLGLYEGIPLSDRQGQTKIFPDKITLFKIPLLSRSVDEKSLQNNIKHTLWHEIAHYYGLNHSQISDLE
ncbi:MAG TPA: metallopeptidase family protein [Patescibacteria group bacterium]|nr:metallopeptidase family protein [Patescibacteria group bacterium]